MQNLLIYLVPLFLKRQCDRTLGARQHAGHRPRPARRRGGRRRLLPLQPRVDSRRKDADVGECVDDGKTMPCCVSGLCHSGMIVAPPVPLVGPQAAAASASVKAADTRQLCNGATRSKRERPDSRDNLRRAGTEPRLFHTGSIQTLRCRAQVVLESALQGGRQYFQFGSHSTANRLTSALRPCRRST